MSVEVIGGYLMSLKVIGGHWRSLEVIGGRVDQIISIQIFFEYLRQNTSIRIRNRVTFGNRILFVFIFGRAGECSSLSTRRCQNYFVRQNCISSSYTRVTYFMCM